jgi:hypothetical protein
MIESEQLPRVQPNLLYANVYANVILALWYMVLQVGDFYFYATLPEPYLSIKGFDISLSLWLLSNGIFGIQTAIFYVIYQWYRMLTIVAVPHLTCSVFLFLVFGISWTLTGWSCLYHTRISIFEEHHNLVFENYMFFKLGIQSMFFSLGWCVFCCPCEN